MTSPIPELPAQDSTAWRPWAAQVDSEARKIPGKAESNHTHVSTSVTDLTETVQDIVAGLLVQGSNITLTYNDAGNTLTIAASSTATTDPEVVRDTIGAALRNGAGITIVVDDANDTITIASTAMQVVAFGTTASTARPSGLPNGGVYWVGTGTTLPTNAQSADLIFLP